MKRYLAVDIGASSGRHIVAWLEEGIIQTREVYRFPNGMTRQDGRLTWDTAALLAHVKAGDTRAQRGDLAEILVAYDLRRPDVLLRPGIPFVNVNVRTADCGLMYLDQHLARRGNRHGYPAKLQPLRGGGLDDGVHPCLHDNPSNIDTCVLHAEII